MLFIFGLIMLILFSLPIGLLVRNISYTPPFLKTTTKLKDSKKNELTLLFIISASLTLMLILFSPSFGEFNGWNKELLAAIVGINTIERIIIGVILLFITYFTARRAMKITECTNFFMLVKYSFFSFQLTSAWEFIASIVTINFDVGHGRPLRINNQEILTEVDNESKWVMEIPLTPKNLDQHTRKALETLWLRDAKLEFASIPAFSKLAWQLAGLGASPELLKKVHFAGIQEINHAQLCFSMASAFADQNWSANSIPEILSTADKPVNLQRLILDCFRDGCLMESFSADIASERLSIVQDVESKKAITIIAKDEHQHGKLSWEILEFLVSISPLDPADYLRKEMNKILNTPSPIPYKKEFSEVMEQASPKMLTHYGILESNRYTEIWDRRVAKTELILNSILYHKKKSSMESTQKDNSLFSKNNFQKTQSSLK